MADLKYLGEMLVSEYCLYREIKSTLKLGNDYVTLSWPSFQDSPFSVRYELDSFTELRSDKTFLGIEHLTRC